MQTLIALFVLFSAFTCTAAAGEPKRHVLGIGGVLIEDTVQTVTAKLGAPIKLTRHAGFISLKYVYRDLSVGFEDESVSELTSHSRASCTQQGLCPGDTVSKMARIYGRPVETNRETGHFLEYYVDDSYSCWYQFSQRRARITSVGIICQP